MKTVIVIGNGFDIDLGWDTSYRSFYEAHKGWKMHQTDEDDLFQHVIKHVEDNWFDFERTIYDYAIHRFNSNKIVERDLQDYNAFKGLLSNFLSKRSSEPVRNDSYAYQLLNAYINTSKRFLSNGNIILNWFSFNYTPIENIARQIDPNVDFRYVPVHGTLEKNNIIFGIHDANQIMPEYRYLQKSMDDEYESHGIVSSLMDANLIVLFGLSMGFIDGVYFKDVLTQISNVDNANNNKEIVFITKDNKTKRDIKNNLLDMGINTQVLFNTNKIEFILTSPENIGTNKEKFALLLSRL